LLGVLPIHAAWSEPGPGRDRTYALDRLCITYLPNARAAVPPHGSPARGDEWTFLAISNPTGDLPAASEEVDRIRRWFVDDARVLTGGEATVTRVLRELPSCKIAHFSCHGFTDLNAPLRSGLVMADRQSLRLADILQAEVELSMAVLSACETALSDPAIPDEVVGLPAAFLSAGAASVVGSLWPVPDQSTALLMQKFYELWRGSRLAPAEALRRAQCYVRDSGRSTASPNATDGQREYPYRDMVHWGAFLFMGRA